MSDIPRRASGMASRSVRVATRPAPVTNDINEDALYNTKPPSSTRRYHTEEDTEVYEQGDKRLVVHRRPPPDRSARKPLLVIDKRRTTLVLLLGATAAIILVIIVSVLVSWWNGVMDNITYGYPRTSQLDAVVGHNDSATSPTHFIFQNYHGHIEVIEIPGGDYSHARVFNGPTLAGSGDDLIAVTGEIRDEDGHIDLIVHVQNQVIVYINDGSSFHQQ